MLDDLELNTGNRSLKKAGKEVELTALEFNLLELLLRYGRAGCNARAGGESLFWGGSSRRRIAASMCTSANFGGSLVSEFPERIASRRSEALGISTLSRKKTRQ